MRISSMVLTVLLSVSLSACNSHSTPSNVVAAQGTYLLSSHNLSGDEAVAVQFGGKVFQINKRTITWDRGGSAQLTPGWGLLELEASAGSIIINLDGVKIAEVAELTK